MTNVRFTNAFWLLNIRFSFLADSGAHFDSVNTSRVFLFIQKTQPNVFQAMTNRNSRQLCGKKRAEEVFGLVSCSVKKSNLMANFGSIENRSPISKHLTSYSRNVYSSCRLSIEKLRVVFHHFAFIIVNFGR